MGVKVLGIAREPVLCADLGKLAWPIRQDQRATFVIQPGIKRAVRVVHARAHKPPPGKLVISRGVEAEGTLEPRKCIDWARNRRTSSERRLVLLSPDEFTTQIKRLVNGTPHRLPAVYGVDAVKMRHEITAEQIVPARVRDTEIKIGIFRQVPIAAQMSHNTHVVLVGGRKHIRGVSTESLSGKFEEPVFRCGNNVLDGDTRIVNA